MTTWTTWGPVRGSCGHRHRSEDAAARCLERDRAGCSGQGGYSDREIRVVRGGRAGYAVTRGPGDRVADDDPAADVEA